MPISKKASFNLGIFLLGPYWLKFQTFFGPFRPKVESNLDNISRLNKTILSITKIYHYPTPGHFRQYCPLSSPNLLNPGYTRFQEMFFWMQVVGSNLPIQHFFLNLLTHTTLGQNSFIGQGKPSAYVPQSQSSILVFEYYITTSWRGLLRPFPQSLAAQGFRPHQPIKSLYSQIKASKRPFRKGWYTKALGIGCPQTLAAQGFTSAIFKYTKAQKYDTIRR